MKFHELYLIGLTGNIACGKSTVLAMLQQRGAAIIDADRVTHELQAPGQPVYRQIVEAFGADMLVSPNGPLDRRKLGALVFSDPAALQRLEQIVHPAVRARVVGWLEELAAQLKPPTPTSQPSTPTIAVIDAIKLLEAGWKERCNAIWVVTCTREQQIVRLMRTRGMSEAEATMRIDAQPPQSEKIAQADVVIDNSGPLEATQRQVEQAWQQIH